MAVLSGAFNARICSCDMTLWAVRWVDKAGRVGAKCYTNNRPAGAPCWC